MAENLKVNAKSKILTFKKKHNLLVDSMNNLLPPITESDIGKVLAVDEDGKYALNEVSGGTKLFLHKLTLSSQQRYKVKLNTDGTNTITQNYAPIDIFVISQKEEKYNTTRNVYLDFEKIIRIFYRQESYEKEGIVSILSSGAFYCFRITSVTQSYIEFEVITAQITIANVTEEVTPL